MALSVNASNGNISHGTGSTLDDMHGGTASWVFLIERTGNGANQHLVSKGGGGGGAGPLILVDSSPGEGAVRVIMFYSTTIYDYISVAGVVPLNPATPTFLVVRFDAGRSANDRITALVGSYRDVLAPVSWNSTQDGTGSAVTDAANNYWIGNVESAPTNPFNGRFLRHQCYKGRYLTDAQALTIQKDWSIISGGECSIAVEYNGTGTQTDNSGDGNDGTVTNGVSTSHQGLPQQIAPNNASWFFPSEGWHVTSTKATSVNPGNYCKASVTVASGDYGDIVLALAVDQLNTLTAGEVPTIAWSIDGGPWTIGSTNWAQPAYSALGETWVLLAGGLAAGTHTVQVFFVGIGLDTPGDRWVTPRQSVQILALRVDDGASLASPTLRPNRAVFAMDSLTEGAAMRGTPYSTTQNNDATQSWATHVAHAVDAEYAIIAFGGAGWTRGIDNQAASSNNPGFWNATSASRFIDKYYSGVTRVWSSTDYVFLMGGGNDVSLSSTEVKDALDGVAALVSSACWIFAMGDPLSGGNGATVQAGVTAHNRTRTVYLAPTVLYTAGTPSLFSYDAAGGGSHGNERANARWGAEIAKLAQEATCGIGGLEMSFPSVAGPVIFGGSSVRMV